MMNKYLLAGLLVAVTLAVIAGASFMLSEEHEHDKNLNLPEIYINTENGAEIVSHEEYVGCTVTVSNCDEVYEFEDKTAEIRGRGNTTWHDGTINMPKKPYKLKFDTATDLFGFGEATAYALIANYGDQSLLRDMFAYSIADAVGVKYQTPTQSAHVYINGVYVGVYLVCNHMEVAENRVDIEQDFSEVDTGYLVELDDWCLDGGTEDEDYFLVDGQSYIVKNYQVGEKDFTAANMQFIKEYMQECWNALKSGDYDQVKSLIDTDSFVKTYVVHELFNCMDVNKSSFYMYKVKGGLLYAGPVWDFDSSSGNSRNNSADAANMYAANTSIWYKALLEYDEFRGSVSQFLIDNHDLIEDKIDSLEHYAKEYKHDFKHNFDKWNILGAVIFSNPVEFASLRSWNDHVKYLVNWLEESLDAMMKEYC